MSAKLHEFNDGAALAEGLADHVSVALGDAIAARGKATIAVSGGSTPKAFFKALSTRDIDWAKVTVTLVDERFVPADNPRSNHQLVADNLPLIPLVAPHILVAARSNLVNLRPAILDHYVLWNAEELAWGDGPAAR